MKTVLHPLQENRAAFLAARYHAACRGQAGTGKTLIGLRAAEIVRARTGLVICPAHVRLQWQKVIAGEWGGEALERWHVMSYNETIRREYGLDNHPYLSPAKFKSFKQYDVCMVDESHFCKTLDSGRTQAVFGANGFARRARFKWALSGTMAPNGRPVELYPMLKALAPKFDMSFQKFTQRYCGAYFDGRGMRFDGASHLDELAEKLRDFMCHLSLKDLDPDRAAPVVERVPLALTAEDLREIHKEEELIGARESKLSSQYEEYSQMGDTSRLLRLLSMAKYRSAVEFITQTLQTYPKVVVFARHVDLIEKLQMHYQERSYNPVVKRGGMTQEVSDMVKHKFIYDPKCRIFIAQEDAAGTGLDGLQKACNLAIDVEPSWTPGVTEQKLHRLDRLGQEADITTYFMLYADGTLDEVKAHVHARKEKNIERMERDRFDVLKGFL